MKKAVTNKKVSQEKADLTDLEGVLAAKAAIMNVLPLTNGAIDGEEHTRILGFLNKWEKALQEEEDEKNWQKEEIKMGDVLIAIDENNQGSCGSVKGVATLIIGKEYPVCYVDYPKGKFGVISEIGCPHCFHISEYRNAFKHKSGLNEGDVLIAISECIMTPGDEVALKIGKEYPILSIFESQEGEDYFIVRDELSEEHSFHACGYKEFFKRKSEITMQNLLTKSIIKKAVDSNPGGGAFCVTDETQLKKLSTPEWACYMGVDTYDKDNLAYCLVRRVDGVSEILLSRVMHSEYALNQEVDNLMQYFNAIKIEEKF